MSILTSIIQFAHAHYPVLCCSGNDCKQVPCTDLILQADGSVKYFGMTFTPDMIQIPLDYACHACYSVYFNLNVPRCIFFALPGMS